MSRFSFLLSFTDGLRTRTAVLNGELERSAGPSRARSATHLPTPTRASDSLGIQIDRFLAESTVPMASAGIALAKFS